MDSPLYNEPCPYALSMFKGQLYFFPSPHFYWGYNPWGHHLGGFRLSSLCCLGPLHVLLYSYDVLQWALKPTTNSSQINPYSPQAPARSLPRSARLLILSCSLISWFLHIGISLSPEIKCTFEVYVLLLYLIIVLEGRVSASIGWFSRRPKYYHYYQMKSNNSNFHLKWTINKWGKHL